MYLKSYKTYLQLEKSLAKNSIEAYTHDIELYTTYLETCLGGKKITEVNYEDIVGFTRWLSEIKLSARSQARIISALRSFYNYLLLEDIIQSNPAELIELPKIPTRYPEVLTFEEIEKMITSIDLSTAEGERNVAILETIYGCGLRVSELVDLKISNIYFKEEYIRIIGKGNKERLVPINTLALLRIKNYLTNSRLKLKIKRGNEDYVFLNRRGSKLTRNMVFLIIKSAANNAGISKNVSPHTLRHSFATHLIRNGANLRAVQQMLGHASITTTEIYVHMNIDFLRENIEKYHPRFKYKMAFSGKEL